MEKNQEKKKKAAKTKVPKGPRSHKNHSLSTKISRMTALTLIIGFIVLVAITGTNVKSSLTAVTEDFFNEVSIANSQEIENIISSAGTAVRTLQDYINEAYETGASQTAEEKAVTATSSLYGVPISALNHEVELFMTGVAKSTVNNNPDIVAMGALFEPYAYDSRLRDFNFYMMEEDAANNILEPYGVYEDFANSEYYSVAAETQERYLTPPYTEEGINMVTVSYPLLYNNETQGVLIADINVNNFSKVFTPNEKYPSMFITIFDKNNTIVYDSNSSDIQLKDASALGMSEKELSELTAGMDGTEAFTVEATLSDGADYICYLQPVTAGEDIWWSQTAVKKSEVNAAITQSVIVLCSLCVLILILILVVTTLVVRKLLKPIGNVVTAAENIAKGQLDINLTSNTDDEIGLLAKAFGATTATLKTIIDDVNYLLSEMSAGNFDIRTRAKESYVGDFENLLTSVRSININLSNTLSQINQASFQVNIGSEQVASAAQALSQGAVEQASSIEELSATITEIADQVKHNAANAQDASTNSNDAGQGVIDSNAQMTEMTAAMNEITEKSNEIGKIIKTIEDIAFQTNVLALNAAVEAARAGAAGKGFAVVADEVRNLATKSAEAAKNTTELIEQTVSAVANGSKIANNTAASLLTVVDKTENVNTLINSIADASENQANAIQQVTLGVDQISGVVQNNSATAEQSAAASEELSAQADMLKNLVSRFTLRTDAQEAQSSSTAASSSYDYSASASGSSSDNKTKIDSRQKTDSYAAKPASKPTAPAKTATASAKTTASPAKTSTAPAKTTTASTKTTAAPAKTATVSAKTTVQKKAEAAAATNRNGDTAENYDNSTFAPIVESPTFGAAETKPEPPNAATETSKAKIEIKMPFTKKKEKEVAPAPAAPASKAKAATTASAAPKPAPTTPSPAPRKSEVHDTPAGAPINDRSDKY